MTNNANNWFCLHVFLSDPQAGNSFLLDWLQPTVRQLRSEGFKGRWFFLRYWHGGPHFRIRFEGLPAPRQEQLRASAVAAAAIRASAVPPTREAFYSAHNFDGQAQDPAALPWWDEGSVVSLPYEPEWERYGGPEGTPVNESLFELSSMLSLAVIGASRDSFGKRVSLALPLMSASLLAFDPAGEHLAPFFARYAGYWQALAGSAAIAATRISSDAAHAASLEAQMARLAFAGGSNSAEALWVDGLRKAFARFHALYERGALVSPLLGAPARTLREYEDAVLNMLSSQMHMMNNRLGFGASHEYWLAKSLVAAAAGTHSVRG